MKKYSDVHDLTAHEPAAKKYYEKLPEYVREQICTRPGAIHSLENLMDYAENFTRGDH